jgi:hypothetical protein
MWGMMADKLLDGDEVMFRQIHPNSLQNGEPASDRFRPYASDDNFMSVDRSALSTAEQSHSLYTSTGRKSAAVFGVSVREFGEEAIDCLSDPLEKTKLEPTNPAHALADYTKHSASSQKLIAKRLQRLAVSRGCLFLFA